MIKTYILKFLTRDLDPFSASLVIDVINGDKEFRPQFIPANTTLTLDDMAELDKEYANYL